tara:strand:- start:701 stop:1777 length:1077 start_codon:yes stop_codon:yes gene_type:complete
MTRRSKIGWSLLVLLALLLLAVHLLLPYIIKDIMNRKMADMGDYRGHVEDVDIVLWRGAYRLNQLNIVKIDGEQQVPFVRLPRTDIKMRLRPFWEHGAIVAEVDLYSPQLNFVDGDSEEQKQSGQGVDWRDKLQGLIPVQLDRVAIIDGEVAFRNFHSEPPVNLYVNQLQLTAHNLTNADQRDGGRDADLEGEGLLLAHAPLRFSSRFDPLGDWQNADFRLRLTDVELTRLNDFATAYGRFDFNAGTGDLVLEAEIRDGQVQGYIKPLLRGVDIFDMQQDLRNPDKSVIRGLWEAVVGGGQQLLQNQRADQFATRVDLSGTVKSPDVSPWQAFFNILRNAFVEAFTSRFEPIHKAADE